MLEPGPSTTFSTPAGRMSAVSRASSESVTGVLLEGFATTVFPAASAGASFQPAIRKGKFHGITTPTTPSGSRTSML